jgi:hypothetical protein
MVPRVRNPASRLRRFGTAFLAALGFGCFGFPASAGGPLGAQGTCIQTSDYGVDLFQGPVFASTRITGARDYFAWSIGAGVLH